jgi:2'-5' RNA ligase
LGLGGNLTELSLLAERITQRTSRWGKLESRAFHPHLTLGRSASKSHSGLRPLGDALARRAMPTELTWTCGNVELIQSRLSPEGAQYTTLATFPLVSEPQS